MNRKRIVVVSALLLLLVILSLGGSAVAQISDNYNLEWHVVAGGGQTADSANYVVHSTIGQTLGGPAPTGDNYRVGGGFWGVGGGSYRVTYLPLIMRNSP